MSIGQRTLQLPEWFEEFRNSQWEIIEEVISHYEQGADLVVLDAPTGVGKTIIGETVRQLLNERGIYICTSKTLMSQFSRDFPYAADLRGRANYLPTDAEEDPWGTMPTCADCDYDKIAKMCSYCTDYTSCPYALAKQEAALSSLVCTNTAYFMRECLGDNSVLSGSFVILDEADCAESEVMGFISVSISSRLQKFLALNPPRHKTKSESWIEWYDYAIIHLNKVAKTLPKGTLRERRRRRTVEELVDKIRAVAKDPDGWVFDGYAEGKIEFKPVTVDKVAPSALWQHGTRWLAMSATIISPEEFVSSLGFQGSWQAVFAPSPFPKERRPIYFTPAAKMIGKAEVAAVEAWPSMAQGLQVVQSWHPDERILVHTHSYRITNFLASKLKEADLDREVFYYLSADDRQEAIANYESTPGAMLLAPSLDRGYDGKDDLARVLVICKVPYPYLGSKQVAARLYTGKEGDIWYSCATARSLMQMAGRAMRHEDDWCRVYVLDSVFGDFYGKWKAGEGSVRTHRLFADHFCESIHWNDDKRFELRQGMRALNGG